MYSAYAKFIRVSARTQPGALHPDVRYPALHFDVLLFCASKRIQLRKTVTVVLSERFTDDATNAGPNETMSMSSKAGIN